MAVAAVAASSSAPSTLDSQAGYAKYANTGFACGRSSGLWTLPGRSFSRNDDET
jgi:hypothetical protein